MSVSFKRKCNPITDVSNIRKKRLEYYNKSRFESLIVQNEKKEIKTTINDLPVEILTEILKYAGSDFHVISQLKYVNNLWYDVCKTVEYYLCQRSWWTIFKVSRYIDSYDKVMVACLGDCSHVKKKYYDMCWIGFGGEQSQCILASLQGTYHIVYNSYSQNRTPRFLKFDADTNKIVQSCTIDCLYMSAEALIQRLREVENQNTTKKNDAEDYKFEKMSRREIRDALGDYDYTQYDSNSDIDTETDITEYEYEEHDENESDIDE